MSSKINSTVEVNGTRYDALSGQMLSPKKLINKSYSSGKKMIDGFVIASHQQVKKTRELPGKAVPKANNLHKRAQQSTTLMRNSVKKPAGQANHKSDVTRQPHHHVPAHRQSRAKTVEQHAKVKRFGLMPSRPKTEGPQPASLQIKARATYRDQAVAAPRAPSMVTSVSHKKLEQLLDEALMQADAHKNMMNKSRRHHIKALKRLPRWVSLGVTALVVLAVAFWLIWQNLPSVAVHVAAARAHVNAAVPAYTPDGFSMAKRLEYNQGTLTMQFKDKTDKTFTLTQQASELNSASLPDTYLPHSENMQTSMIGGTTVYIYGDKNDAAWVNHGVLYKLNNSADLPADQVLKIVQGL